MCPRNSRSAALKALGRLGMGIVGLGLLAAAASGVYLGFLAIISPYGLPFAEEENILASKQRGFGRGAGFRYQNVLLTKTAWHRNTVGVIDAERQ